MLWIDWRDKILRSDLIYGMDDILCLELGMNASHLCAENDQRNSFKQLSMAWVVKVVFFCVVCYVSRLGFGGCYVIPCSEHVSCCAENVTGLAESPQHLMVMLAFEIGRPRAFLLVRRCARVICHG